MIEHQTRDDEDYIVFIAEQKFNEAKPIWFYFRVSGLTKERTVFRIGNAHQFLMDADISEFAGDAPVYRELDGQWKRTQKCTIEFEEDGFPIVEFIIDNCPHDVEVAFCFPYGPTQLKETMSAVEGFEKRCIGYSTKGNPIYRYATDGGRKNNKPGIYLLSRQHAQETGGAWVLDGILRYFGSEEGRAYREKLSIWVTPMVDVDGVLYPELFGSIKKMVDLPFEWDMVPMPVNADGGSTSWMGSAAWGALTASDTPDLAKSLVQFMTTKKFIEDMQFTALTVRLSGKFTVKQMQARAATRQWSSCGSSESPRWCGHHPQGHCNRYHAVSVRTKNLHL